MAVNPKRVALIGCGAQARYCWEIFQPTADEVVAVFDPIGRLVGSSFYGLEVRPWDPKALSDGAAGATHAMVCAAKPALKKELTRLVEPRLPLTRALHPDCTVASTASLGLNTIVNPKAVIGPDARVGAGCMLHAGVVVEHDCQLGDYVNLAMGVILAGRVRVGPGATIFSGSVVAPNLSIGAGTVVGAGSLVLSDLPPGVIAHGSPAKVMGKAGQEP